MGRGREKDSHNETPKKSLDEIAKEERIAPGAILKSLGMILPRRISVSETLIIICLLLYVVMKGSGVCPLLPALDSDPIA